ncbi:major tail protein [Atopobium fossor]|uniref:major tail protein n=1 Tax=Atopobium fossor TaxID=39487 RepID=UPI0004000373|nr:major tail protein [Atopobium fossor]
MAEDKNAGVRFGVKNVYYAIYKEDTGVYDTPKPIPGAIKLTLTPEGSESTFYADDVAYASFSTNGGYSVELEDAYITDEMRRDILGEVQDKNKVQIEVADAKPNTIALMWEFSGSKIAKRGLLYKVTFSRATEEGNTKTDSTTPDTNTMSGKAITTKQTISSVKRDVVKASVTDETATKAIFGKWFEKVYLPDSNAA